MPHRRSVSIHTQSIGLGAFLKFAGIAATGGEAKTLITGRRVLVNGRVEIRRGRRLVVGDLVAVQGGPMLVVAGNGDGAPSPPVDPGLP